MELFDVSKREDSLRQSSTAMVIGFEVQFKEAHYAINGEDDTRKLNLQHLNLT